MIAASPASSFDLFFGSTSHMAWHISPHICALASLFSRSLDPRLWTLRESFFLRSVLTSNRHQTTWFCPSAATQLRAGLRLPIGCTTIQPVPRNESCAVPRRSRGLFHPSQVRRTTNATKRHPGPRPSFVKLCRIFIWTTHVFSL